MSTSLIDGFLIESTCSRLPSLFIAGGEKLDGAVIDTSVADLACLSRILIFVHTGSRIQKQQQQKKREVKKNLLSYLFCSHKNNKIENKFFLNW
jgi:hypothetical protein